MREHDTYERDSGYHTFPNRKMSPPYTSSWASNQKKDREPSGFVGKFKAFKAADASVVRISEFKFWFWIFRRLQSSSMFEVGSLLVSLSVWLLSEVFVADG